MDILLDTIGKITPLAAVAITALIAFIIYQKGTSEAAIIKTTKAQKREKLNLDYAEKIIIEADELQDGVSGLLENNLTTAQKIINEIKDSKNNKKEDFHNIIKNNLLKLEDDEEAKIHYHSINKFYKLVRTDKNINGINIEINKEIETIREIIGIIEGMFSQVYFSKASKKEIESEMKDIMEKYGSSSNIERHLEYTVGNIISVCKERML